MKRFALLLLPVGPLSVAALRFLVPYHSTDGSLATARAVLAHPDRERAVVWLGLIALVTLVPGVLTVAGALHPSRLKSWAVGLSIPGYLCLGVLFAEDNLLSAGAGAHLDQRELAAHLDGLGPSHTIGLAIFVIGHVVGTVLLGLALLRSRRVPAWAAWSVTVSQPLHFIAAVILGNPPLDLIAWMMTALGMAVVARVLVAELPTYAPDHDRAADVQAVR
jgi:hypothetical protein